MEIEFVKQVRKYFMIALLPLATSKTEPTPKVPPL